MNIRKPHRVSRTYVQNLVAPPSAVFPLLCPVREADWIPGWNPLFVLSDSGVAERDCIFATSATPSDAIWYITRHQPEEGTLEMLKITPSALATKLSITVQASGDGSQAAVTYTHTSLGAEGDAFIESFTEEFYRDFMRTWEARLNHYLAHGNALPAGGAT